MRGISFALIIALMLVLLVGCNPKAEPTAEELMNDLTGYFGNELHSCRAIYKKSASEYSSSYFSHRLAGLIYYGIKLEKMWELDLLSDYAVRLADDESGSEIHIFKVRSRSDVDTVEKLLRKRLEYLQNRSVYIYIPEDYEKYVMSAQVYSIDRYVFLLATPDNTAAIKLLKDKI